MASRAGLGTAERLVGVDITDDSIRGVEVAGGQVKARAEVNLPPGAVVAGDIHDPAAVKVALKELWKVGRFATKTAIVGAPLDQVVARQADLPDLSLEELRTSLRFEVGGVIPFPASESILDCTEIERLDDEDGQRIARVLVIAAYQPVIEKWLTVAGSAGVKVRAVDHWAHALVRAAGPSPQGGAASELIVDIGADTLSILVHQGGRVWFARSLPGFSRSATVSLELEAELARIERYRRRAEAAGATDVIPDVFAQRDPIVDAVRSTADYISFQAGSVPISAIRVSGDLDRARPVVAQLAEIMGVTVSVVPGLPAASEALRRGTTVHPERDLIAYGYALGRPNQPFGPSPAQLLPSGVVEQSRQRRARFGYSGVVGASVLVVAAVTLLGAPDPTSAQQEADRAQNALAVAQGKITKATGANPDAAQLAKLNAARAKILTGDVDWDDLVARIIAVSPANSPLVAVEAHRSDGTDKNVIATVALTVQGGGLSATAEWLTALASVAELANVLPGSSSSAGAAGAASGSVTATLTANVTPAALSHRLDPATTDKT
jgi:type IV pilus assembly protein PilM